MSESRLNLDQSILANTIRMADGNPGSIVALNRMMASRIDKDAEPWNGIDVIMALDSAGIYGGDVYIFFNDICHNNVLGAITLLRGMQLGFVDKIILADACRRQDRSGASIITFEFIQETYNKVKQHLPNFNS